MRKINKIELLSVSGGLSEIENTSYFLGPNFSNNQLSQLTSFEPVSNPQGQYLGGAGRPVSTTPPKEPVPITYPPLNPFRGPLIGAIAIPIKRG
jgi:hypothetical protein